jgi:hypothetical protein
VALEEFGFDFGEAEPPRRAPAFAPPAVPQPSAPVAEPTGETEEDLWSEVSLRDRGNDVLEVPPRSGQAFAGAGVPDLEEETPPTDETMFEEVSATPVISEPEAGAEEFEEPAPEPAFAAAAHEVPQLAADVVPAPELAAETAAPRAVDQAELERLVASRVEAAVRQVLEPVVQELARTMIETIAWEVIPDLAEAMIRAEIERIRQSVRTD